MRLRQSLIGLAMLFPLTAAAHNITMGSTLPAVTVNQAGELMLNGDSLEYAPWRSWQLKDRVFLIQAIAGRTNAKEMNAAMIDAIKAQNYDRMDYQTVTIINKDDAVWGTGRMVQSSAEDSKREYPWSAFVLDNEGKVAKTWDLPDESSTIILIDRYGEVLFVKEGQLSQSEVDRVISLIDENL
ncbi:putative protein YtfJ [Vibrio stylophorae]|uniref:YtfJ family protein n=1 Tax=Vibrio stylophorae TaxID=659351 RepID=A0ABN8DYP4_9VIBR|nr:YtfJ family protein [Vibrio stylophorae]CAH0534492.1 putative protein YtfJ [Vibrio stylophorae]